MVRYEGVLTVENAFFTLGSKEVVTDYGNSFVKTCICHSCGHRNEKFDLAQCDFDQSKIQKPYKPCVNCGHPIRKDDLADSKDIEFWNVMNLFIYGSKIGLFEPAQYLTCQWCHQYEEYFRKNSKNSKARRNCPECGKSLEMKIDFQLNKELKLFIKSRSGLWLEWYSWKLFSKGKRKIEHNNKWTIEGKDVEVDAEFNFKKKRVAILCDTKSKPTFNLENFYLLAKKYDSIVLVTTQKKVDEKIIGSAKEHFPKGVGVIKGLAIEKELMNFSDLTFGKSC